MDHSLPNYKSIYCRKSVFGAEDIFTHTYVGIILGLLERVEAA